MITYILVLGLGGVAGYVLHSAIGLHLISKVKAEIVALESRLRSNPPVTVVSAAKPAVSANGPTGTV